jgi:hypothetical protein
LGIGGVGLKKFYPIIREAIIPDILPTKEKTIVLQLGACSPVLWGKNNYIVRT